MNDLVVVCFMGFVESEMGDVIDGFLPCGIAGLADAPQAHDAEAAQVGKDISDRALDFQHQAGMLFGEVDGQDLLIDEIGKNQADGVDVWLGVGRLASEYEGQSNEGEILHGIKLCVIAVENLCIASTYDIIWMVLQSNFFS